MLKEQPLGGPTQKGWKRVAQAMNKRMRTAEGDADGFSPQQCYDKFMYICKKETPTGSGTEDAELRQITLMKSVELRIMEKMNMNQPTAESLRQANAAAEAAAAKPAKGYAGLIPPPVAPAYSSSSSSKAAPSKAAPASTALPAAGAAAPSPALDAAASDDVTAAESASKGSSGKGKKAQVPVPVVKHRNDRGPIGYQHGNAEASNGRRRTSTIETLGGLLRDMNERDRVQLQSDEAAFRAKQVKAIEAQRTAVIEAKKEWGQIRNSEVTAEDDRFHRVMALKYAQMLDTDMVQLLPLELQNALTGERMMEQGCFFLHSLICFNHVHVFLLHSEFLAASRTVTDAQASGSTRGGKLKKEDDKEEEEEEQNEEGIDDEANDDHDDV